ncbi:MAG: MBL fold metallo-hydrolase [Thermoprotei archaeon]|nr:MAG: MBL fold metallo-hydrolase [Thermoprotei archaeon]RLF00080.1 MAG: MBL fold metallo-hydrolase [Thermoprotei archaeon]HDI75375.1 MBL fold metallo-hydrolase [Thermoprotei archaeon]
MSLEFKPIWADSLGAKSFSTLVKTPDVVVLIDPGVAIMHGSFPAPPELKAEWVEIGYEKIVEASKRAQVVVITHYHYDHFTDFDEVLYRNKVILAKSPNEYINDSQRGRALRFYSKLFALKNVTLEEVMEEPIEKEYSHPLEELPHASTVDYGDYSARKRELLEKGFKWFKGRVDKWNSYKRIPEHEGEVFKLFFADGREFSYGSTLIRFTKPLFHGIEYSRVGWVIGVVVEYKDRKLLYSSDVNGPIIEDYADWIIREEPNIILLDGPATYTLGYMLNQINLRRAVENIKRIIRETSPQVILLDHHLPREPKYVERLSDVYELAEREGVKVMTVAEYFGETPVVLRKWS